MADESQVDHKARLTILFNHCPVVLDKNIKLACLSEEQIQMLSSQVRWFSKVQDGGCVEVVVKNLTKSLPDFLFFFFFV